MFSYNEPGIPNYTPHPAFFHMYYMRRHTGDVLLNSTMTGATGVVITPTAFSSGEIGASMVNTSKVRKVVRLNLKDYSVGERFYTFNLTGTDGVDFSRKVFINGTGGTLEAGGPENYESIKAKAAVIDDEIRIALPPLSAVYVLVEPGTKVLAINNEVTAVEPSWNDNAITVFPNPSSGRVTVSDIPAGLSRIVISDLRGSILYSRQTVRGIREASISTDLPPGIYLISFCFDNHTFTKRLVIK
jgi:hypothetical protein